MNAITTLSREIGGRVKLDPSLIIPIFLYLLPLIQQFLGLVFNKSRITGRDMLRYYRADDVMYGFKWIARARRQKRFRQLIKRKLILSGADSQNVEDEIVNSADALDEFTLDQMIMEANREVK